MLNDAGSSINITAISESRDYTVLAYAAFKNHANCFKIVAEHAFKYSYNPNRKPPKD